jgi:hypothetical protein
LDPSKEIGKWLLIAGGLVFLAGLFFFFGSRFLPLGRLPGDVRVDGERYSFYFPIVTCIIISIILTVILNLFFSKK